MRIQQKFTFSLIFSLIYTFQLQANKINDIPLEECTLLALVDLSNNLSSVKIGIIKQIELADCPPQKEYCVGIIKFKDGSFYNGEISYGKPHGKGIMKWPDESNYVGAFANGERNGFGIFKFKNGDRYEGEWRNNQMNGYGFFIWANGTEYLGDFNNNKMHGTGSVVLNNNEGYSGEWNNNLPHGQGRFIQNNGSTYIGSAKNGLRDGEGIIIWEVGDTIFGNWALGKFDGEVRFQYQNGDQLLTEWIDGQIAYQSSYLSVDGKLYTGDLKDIEKKMFYSSFENDFASNIQFTYYSIGLEYDINYQYEAASEFYQMALNIENEDHRLDESIDKSLFVLKKKQNAGWAKLNKE